MSKKMECPRCKEIELKPTVSDNLIEWECICGHYETADNPDYDPTPDEQSEPPVTWLERANLENPR